MSQQACKAQGVLAWALRRVPFESARERTSPFPRDGVEMCLIRHSPKPFRKSARALSGPHPAGRARGTRAPDATAGERRCRGFARTRATHHAQAEGEHIRDARVKRCPPRANAFKRPSASSTQVRFTSTRKEEWVVGFRSTRWFYAKRSPFSCTVAESCVRASGARTFVAGT